MSLISRYVLLAALCCGPLAQAHEPQMPAVVAAQLAIGGAVQQPLSLSADELRQSDPAQIVELRLPGREAGAPASVLRGVRLRALLERAKLKTADHNTVKKLAIVAAASDGYKVVFSWNELFNAELGDVVMVVFERDGKPLAASEGPLALISGKDIRTGPRHVKWLQSVEVRQIVD
jgi:DMSO/TMAO reductase YedYZ molybdopterin-dependent catalytic subunit